MLRPLVRSVGRGTVIQSRSHAFPRQIHTTPIRTIDDDTDNPKLPTESENLSSEQPPSTSNESRTADDATTDPSLTNRVRGIRESNQNDALPERQRERESIVEEQQRRYNIDSSTPSQLEDFTDEDPLSYESKVRDLNFRDRKQQRFSKLREEIIRFRIPSGSIDERRAEYNKEVHETRTQAQEAGNQRGKEIIDMINSRRAERGEKPVGSLAREEQAREIKKIGRRDGGGERGSRWATLTSGEDGEGGRIHHYHPSFNPSEAEFRGLDEVDMELGYELPEAVVVSGGDSEDKPYVIMARDGTIKENRRTNRDRDDVAPDDTSSFINLEELGQVGPSYYHELKYPPKDEKSPQKSDKTAEQLANAEKAEIEDETSEMDLEDAAEEPSENEEEEWMEGISAEDQETDLQELWDIKTEIETEGLASDIRRRLRTERKANKRRLESREQERVQQGYSGVWDKLVPLPQKHKPETANLLDYVPPTLTHESFRFGIPALPVGTQGRRRAVHSVSMAEVDMTLPSATTFENMSFTPAQLEEYENSKDELASMLDNLEIPEEPREKSVLFGKLPKFKAVDKGGKRPKDKFQKHEIENIYSADQLAIWKEMNKGSFAPKGFKYPDDYPDETDNQPIDDAQLQRDNEARLASLEIMDQLDSATLKAFRRRDEFEVRDIRRRLGLPYEEGTEISFKDPYKKTRIDPSDFPPPEKREEIEDAAKELEATEEESAVLQASEVEMDEETQLSRARFDNESDETILDEEFDDAEDNEPIVEEMDPTEEPLEFWLEAKQYLSTLSSRIHHLRQITQETRDRIRRHGTAEMILPPQPSSPDSTQLTETSPSAIMEHLHEKFMEVHTTLEKLEILATAVLIGDRGPLDKAFSEHWVESHLHANEAQEFEETAVRMGYKPNSVTMDPVLTEEQEMQWERMQAQVFQYKTRVGLEGEYRDFGNNEEDLPEPLRKAGKYATRSGMDTRQKWLKVGMLGHTLQGMGLLGVKTPKFEKKKKEGVEAEVAAAGTDDGDVVEEGEDEEGLDDGEEYEEELEDEEYEENEEGEEYEEDEEEDEEDEDEDEDYEEDEEGEDEEGKDEEDGNEEKENEEFEEDEEEVGEYPAVHAPPGENFPAEYTQVMEKMRKSMADLDKDISSLEESYDTFLATHPPPPPPPEQIPPPEQPPTQETTSQ